MNIGLFGGTFDPIHLGHTALARAARERYELGRIYFVPANVPPHKQTQRTAYAHRYAMVVLATMGEKAFLPSLLEGPETVLPEVRARKGEGSRGVPRANYTIDTVRRLQPVLKRADRLFFLIGIDAFRDIAKWHEAEALLRACEFIVASRPGYSLADIANALPQSLRPKAEVTKPFSKQPAKGDLVLPGATIHLLENVQQNISATAIREAVAHKRALTKYVDASVAEYIKKMGLYTH
ncbi:MAG TPA: nicotinate-nicotinamide nucleotide adenylyltransferase [Terriglobales bacterium]|nr:nicotinate-nicotinamide nucleotide adenylyltransferase [Terriglobales bacterium]